jgi:hypothetical protein
MRKTDISWRWRIRHLSGGNVTCKWNGEVRVIDTGDAVYLRTEIEGSQWICLRGVDVHSLFELDVYWDAYKRIIDEEDGERLLVEAVQDARHEVVMSRWQKVSDYSYLFMWTMAIGGLLMDLAIGDHVAIHHNRRYFEGWVLAHFLLFARRKDLQEQMERGAAMDTEEASSAERSVVIPPDVAKTLLALCDHFTQGSQSALYAAVHRARAWVAAQPVASPSGPPEAA